MLRHVRFEQCVIRIERAVERVYAQRSCLTQDQGGSSTTTEFMQAIRDQL